MCLFQFWCPHNICLGVGLLGHVVVLFILFKGISILSSIMAVSIYIPTNSARGLPLLHRGRAPSPAVFVCRLSDDSHSYWCEVISACSFDLRFSNNEQYLASFHVLLAICMSSLEKCLFRSFPHFLIGVFVFLVLSGKSPIC